MKKTLCNCGNQGFLPFGSLSIDFQQKDVGMTLHSRLHLSVKAESNFEHFQFLTRHYCRKLGISKEVEFLSEPRLGLISSSKSKFRDQDQSFWSGRNLGKSNPNFPLNQKTNTVEDELQIQFQLLKLVRSKYFVFPFQVLS